ncbi:hypothetical protein P8452_44389 [Trifolium repens]|nr:hypothetical protein P8452_44389 [Trifolium repens]
MKINHFTFLSLCALLLISIVAIELSKDGKQLGEIEEPKTNIGIKSNGATGGDSGNVIPFPSNGNVIPFPIKGKRGGSGNVIPFPRCGGRGGNVIDFPSGS